jgi:mannose-6-phosphate isomerase-like protein (cupin superfamily)
MLIRKLDPEQFVDAYDVKEQMFYPWSDVVETPFGSGWLVVEPGRRTKPHNHHEGETFFILRGQGKMTVGDESRTVEPGDVIYFPPFGDHILENTSEHEDLHFLTIWWEDMAAVAGLKRQAATASLPEPTRLLVVTAVTADRADAAGASPSPPSPPSPVSRAAAIHSRYARLRGARVRALADPKPLRERGAAAVYRLFERLAAAGEIATRSPRGPYRFDAARHREAIERHTRQTAMSPRLRALVDAARANGHLDLAVSRAPAAGDAAASDLPVPGQEAQVFEPWFVRAATLLAALEPDEQPVVFVDAGQALQYVAALPALAAAVAASAVAGAASYAPLALVDCADHQTAGGTPDLAPAADEPPADWLPWLRSLAATLAEDHGGLAPPTQAWTPEQQQFTGTLLRCVEDAAAAYQAATFSPRRAARALSDLVAAAAGFAERELPWRGLANRREERNTGVALQVLAAKVLAVTAYPLLPAWSARLWSCLGYASTLGEGSAAAWEDTPSFVPTGSPIRGLAELAAAGGPRG